MKRSAIPHTCTKVFFAVLVNILSIEMDLFHRSLIQRSYDEGAFLFTVMLNSSQEDIADAGGSYVYFTARGNLLSHPNAFELVARVDLGCGKLVVINLLASCITGFAYMIRHW